MQQKYLLLHVSIMLKITGRSPSETGPVGGVEYPWYRVAGPMSSRKRLGF